MAKKTTRTSSRRRGKRSRSPLGAFLRWLPVAALAVAVAFVAIFLLRDYHALTIKNEVVGITGAFKGAGVYLRVADEVSAEETIASLTSIERRAMGAFSLEDERRLPGKITARMNYLGDHYPLTILWREEARERAPLLTIIIDDAGMDLDNAKQFLDLPVPVVLAVIPHLKHSSDIAALARERKRPFILHMPMEPLSYPENDPGEGALFAGMSEYAAINNLNRALNSALGASGVNNHMGSKATADPLLMRRVMEALKTRGLYFIDSRTTPKSVAAKEARAAGVAYATRDVFIDNDDDEGEIIANLNKGVALAAQRGEAIVIGHARRGTLAAMERWTRSDAISKVRVAPPEDILNIP